MISRVGAKVNPKPLKQSMASLSSSASKISRTATTRLPRPATKVTSQQSHKKFSSTFAHWQKPVGFRQIRSRQQCSHQATYIYPCVQGRSHSTQHNLKHHEAFNQAPEPNVHPIYEPITGTFQYIVADPSTLATVIIDPVLDFNPCTSSISTASADAVLSLIQKENYKVTHILETHAHADHISSASYLQAQLGKTGTRPHIGIGHRIDQVQKLFGHRYGIPVKEHESVFDHLFSDDEVIQLGALQIEVIHLPGHTPDHVGYKISSNVFCGDSLFHPSIGTARTDFPGGSASDLWSSAQRLLALPDDTRIWMGHDYPPEGRDAVPFMTVKQHKGCNRHVRSGVQREEYLELRRKRDVELGAPKLLHQSLQINVRGGKLPGVDKSGQRMLKVPLRWEGGIW